MQYTRVRVLGIEASDICVNVLLTPVVAMSTLNNIGDGSQSHILATIATFEPGTR